MRDFKKTGQSISAELLTCQVFLRQICRMVRLGGFGQKNNLVFENIEKAGTDEEGLHFTLRGCDRKPAGLKGGDERGMIDQDSEASIASGRHN